ncbi:hypothetical protein [Streptomyces sp. 135]|nr:hypothetical protein [Streptomyces sp. 135]
MGAYVEPEREKLAAEATAAVVNALDSGTPVGLVARFQELVHRSKHRVRESGTAEDWHAWQRASELYGDDVLGWRHRLRLLLHIDAPFAAELRALLAEFEPPVVEERLGTVHNAVSGGSAGSVVQAGHIGAVTVQAPASSPAR